MPGLMKLEGKHAPFHFSAFANDAALRFCGISQAQSAGKTPV
jgi:hypothetical protein